MSDAREFVNQFARIRALFAQTAAQPRRRLVVPPVRPRRSPSAAPTGRVYCLTSAEISFSLLGVGAPEQLLCVKEA